MQFCLLAILVFSTTKTPHFTSYIIAAAAIILGLSAMLTMTKRTLTVMPEIAPGAELSTSGPYQFIRHPMYVALTLLALAMLIQDISLLRLGIFLMLVLLLIFKARYEERLLIKHYRQYARYRKNTNWFIPKIY